MDNYEFNGAHDRNDRGRAREPLLNGFTGAGAALPGMLRYDDAGAFSIGKSSQCANRWRQKPTFRMFSGWL